MCLFLDKFLEGLFEFIALNTPKRIKSYRFIIKIVRFVMMERRNVTNVVETTKKQVDEVNNYFIVHKKEKLTLLNIYDDLIKDFTMSNIDINFIISVNYFKKYMTILFKNIIYYIIIRNFIVYQNKNEKLVKYVIKPMYDDLRNNQYHRIIELLRKFNKEAHKRLEDKFGQSTLHSR